MSELRRSAVLYGAALGLALGVKAFYASASAEALGFVLGPTTALVTLFSGQRFEFEPGAGYLSRELAYLIAPACAGLNYWIIAFATLVLGFTPRIERPAACAAWLLAAAALAYLTTLLVNAARIAIALELRAAALPVWLSASAAHRLEGIAVYLSSLWLLNACVEACFAPRGGEPRRIALVPLATYLSVTLLVPLANGAWQRDEFWQHAGVVLAASLTLGALAHTALTAARWLYSSRKRA